MAYCRHSRESGNLEHEQAFTENFLGVTIQKMVFQIFDLFA